LFAVHVAITSAAVALPGFLHALSGDASGIATQAGWIIGTGALVASLGSLFGGKLAGRIGARRMIALSLGLAGLAAIPQALVPGVPELWALRLTTSLFLGSAIPVANLLIKDASPPERQGAAFGFASSATAMGFALGPMGGGLIASSLGFRAAFLIPGAALLGLAIVLGAVWAMRSSSGGSGKKRPAFWKAILTHLAR
jgi:DHA1 family multidrug resistance protein-like MFS transporter